MHYNSKPGRLTPADFLLKMIGIKTLFFFQIMVLKFIYSEKATKFCVISIVDLSYVVPVKSTVEISQNFVAFSEYMNFKKVAIQKTVRSILTYIR